MASEFDQLVQCFEKAIENKSKDKFGKDDIDAIYNAANKALSHEKDLQQQQLEKLRDLWVKLAEGRIDKSGAMKKLQGTSRAEAIRSVLQSMQ